MTLYLSNKKVKEHKSYKGNWENPVGFSPNVLMTREYNCNKVWIQQKLYKIRITSFYGHAVHV
jgi:hypothetical protein